MYRESNGVWAGMVVAVALLGAAPQPHPGVAYTVNVKLSEWNVVLSQASVAAGSVTFVITNAGSIPHGLEVGGQGIQQEIETIPPAASDTLTLTLKPGSYEVYCPVGSDSHKKLGMDTHLKVVSATSPAPPAAPAPSEMSEAHMKAERVQTIRVTGGGPVIQILPGPFPFPDSAAPILAAFGDEREGLESQVKNGPYSNNVARSSGTFTFTAWDKGAVRDSVDGVAEFATQDGAHWKLVMDRVQTKDVPHHPLFFQAEVGIRYLTVTGVQTCALPI